MKTPHLVTLSPLHLVTILSLAAAARAAAPKLALDQPAPEISAMTLDGKTANLATLRADNKDKIIVLQFASITDPVFRAHAANVEKLAIKESDKAVFVILYTKEAHASDGTAALDLNDTDGYNFAEPQNQDERLKLARQVPDRLKIKNQTVLVDNWTNASFNRYGTYPNMTFVIDAKGNLQAGYPFMDTPKVQAAIDILAENLPMPPDIKGPSQRTGPAPFDFSTAAMDMTGGRGPATIATILERVSLTDQQRLTLFPALADFLADVQTFRQTRQAVPNPPGPARGPNRAGAPTPPPARAGVDPNAPKETKTVEDLQTAQAALKASADRVKSIINQTMPKKDATALLDALNNMVPGQRLF